MKQPSENDGRHHRAHPASRQLQIDGRSLGAQSRMPTAQPAVVNLHSRDEAEGRGQPVLLRVSLGIASPAVANRFRQADTACPSHRVQGSKNSTPQGAPVLRAAERSTQRVIRDPKLALLGNHDNLSTH